MRRMSGGGLRETTEHETTKHETTKPRKITKPLRTDDFLGFVVSSFVVSWLLITAPPRHLCDHAGKVRPSQHVVERGQLAVEHFAQPSLRALEAVLEILVD